MDDCLQSYPLKRPNHKRLSEGKNTDIIPFYIYFTYKQYFEYKILIMTADRK